MRPDDLIMVSVDDHLVEPPTMFDAHIPAKYRDRAPEGRAQGRRLRRVGVRRQRDPEHRAQRRGRPAQGGVRHRADRLRRDAARAATTSPSGSRTWTPAGSSARCASRRFPGLLAAGSSRPPTTRTSPSPSLQAYNDWHVDEWCGAAPGPLHPDGPARCSGTPSWPPPRCAASPRRASTRSPSPRTRPPSATRRSTATTGTRCGRRSSTPDVVLSIHLGSSGQLAVTAADAPMDVLITLQPMNICSAAADLLWSRVLKEFPDIKIALSEGGTGWIPYFLDRLDRTYDMHHLWTGQDFGGRLPSRGVPRALPHLLHRRPDRRPAARRHRHRQHRLGVRLPALRLVVARRRPRSWPRWPPTCPTTSSTRSPTRTPCAGTPTTPSPTCPKAEATVGALRAKAAGHDVSDPLLRQGPLRAHRQGRRPRHDHRPGHRLTRPPRGQRLS